MHPMKHSIFPSVRSTDFKHLIHKDASSHVSFVAVIKSSKILSRLRRSFQAARFSPTTLCLALITMKCLYLSDVSFAMANWKSCRKVFHSSRIRGFPLTQRPLLKNRHSYLQPILDYIRRSFQWTKFLVNRVSWSFRFRGNRNVIRFCSARPLLP